MMHVIFAVIAFLSFLSLTSPFIFFLLSLSISYSNCLGHCSCSPYGYYSYLYTKSTHEISHFYPHCLSTIFVYCRHPSKVLTTLLAAWVQPPLPSKHVKCFLSLFHYISHDKLSPNSFYCVPISLLLNGKTLGHFLPIPSSMH